LIDSGTALEKLGRFVEATIEGNYIVRAGLENPLDWCSIQLAR